MYLMLDENSDKIKLDINPKIKRNLLAKNGDTKKLNQQKRL